MAEDLFKNRTIKQINKYYQNLWALSHVSSVARWDSRTYMPEDGVKARGKALSKVSSLRQKLFLDDKFVDLIKKAEQEKDLNDYEKGIVRTLTRSLEYYEKLPADFLEELTETTSDAHSAWKKAREKQDFTIFQPLLTKVVELTKQKADYLGYEDHPYDSLIDLFEEDFTTQDIIEYFDTIRKPLKDIFEKSQKNPEIVRNHALEEMSYSEEKMIELNNKVLDFFQVDHNRFRSDVAAHPFTTRLAQNDVRITTRYAEKDFRRSLTATIHEFGHALHSLQCDPKLAQTPLTGHSYSIAESQSRFWENLVGKSKVFIQHFEEQMTKLSQEIKDYINKEETSGLYKYFNMVKPSFIRVEADEVTYHFHIMIRFEIEKGLIDDTYQVKDLPQIWNKKMKDYLGITPPNDSLGVLQDVHWSEGYFGYFPTYSMGTAASQIWVDQLEKDLGKLDTLIKSKEGIVKIKNWLKDKVHKYSDTYTMKGLFKKSINQEFTAKPLLKYLDEKYC